MHARIQTGQMIQIYNSTVFNNNTTYKEARKQRYPNNQFGVQTVDLQTYCRYSKADTNKTDQRKHICEARWPNLNNI